MSALPEDPAAAMRVEASSMTVGDLDAVMTVENAAYAFPWTRGNFVDSLAAGYHTRLLRVRGRAGTLAGYLLAMQGAGELHLLNLTVAPAWQRQGLAIVLLDELLAIARAQRLAQVWLEVRDSNERAQAIYGRYGFAAIGRRRGYYPAAQGTREDAIVMGLAVDGLD